MKIAVDLHIHSGLSPCSEEDMTPNNIIGMAKLKGLDAISITDHNCLKNIPAFTQVAEEKRLLLIPGVEITTKEDVHLLGYFRDLESALNFQQFIENNLIVMAYHEKIFGRQLLYNQYDEIIGEYPSLLLNATKLTLREAIDAIKKFNGISIPAHIDRGSYSILSNLGFIPPDLLINTVELTTSCRYSSLVEKHPYLSKYKKIKSSDAHQLGDILEREVYLEVEELSISGVIEALEKM
ncbi:PHP domain-containing protein [Alkaliphilus transvaalensis]|uniref:PHP domain-containing protein n=1 Tax=Alkaliphilus transvaalensis TaxID=114628 RepID=UPI00047EB7EF|nr:PHP domain-containing protein [Alkaliphilus transvaalensis]